MRRLACAETDDRGFTLVELVIYIALFGVILTIVATLLINSLHAQNTVRGIGNSSNASRVIERSLQSGLTNATKAKVWAMSTTQGQLVQAEATVVKVASGVATSTSICRAWYYSAVTNGFYLKTSKTGPVVGPANGSAAALTGWTMVASKSATDKQQPWVRLPTTGSEVQSVVTAPFTAVGATQIKFALTVTDGSVPVVMNTTFSTPSITATVGSLACISSSYP